MIKALAHIHAYPPISNAGAEWAAHTLFKYLNENGWDIEVASKECTEPYTIDNVRVHPFNPTDYFRNDWQMVFTHLGQTGFASDFAYRKKLPITHLIHNHHDYPVIRRRDKFQNYVIYNSEWVERELQYKVDSVLLYPPVYWKDYEVENKGNFVTLINVNENKGGKILIELAKKMPHINFIGVIGSYADQIVDKSIKNITYIEHTSEIKKVYEKTKVLIMPSEYESYGRTAVEASSSGIPVIANPTPGLKEALKGSNLLIEKERITDWVDTINKLFNDKEFYKSQSEWHKNRAKELGPYPQLKEVKEFLEKRIKSKRTMSEVKVRRLKALRKFAGDSDLMIDGNPTNEYIIMKGCMVETTSNTKAKELVMSGYVEELPELEVKEEKIEIKTKEEKVTPATKKRGRKPSK